MHQMYRQGPLPLVLKNHYYCGAQDNIHATSMYRQHSTIGYNFWLWAVAILSLALYSSPTMMAQVIRTGQVIDAETGEGIPYASLYITTLQSGSITSSDGLFRLSLPEGEHSIEVRSMGYQSRLLQLKSYGTETEPMSIALQPLTKMLPEVAVSGRRGSEDPAYPILRRVMYRVPIYRAMLQSYEQTAFVRGSMRLEKVPLILGRVSIEDQNLRLKDLVGKTFVNEIHAKTSFTAPKTYRTHILAERNSAPEGLEVGISPTNHLNIGIYDTYMGAGLKDRSCLSPIAPEAYNVYRYRLLGRSIEGDKTIYHIHFRARKSSASNSEGELQIIGGSWAVRSIRMKFDIKQTIYQDLTAELSEVQPGIYLPVTYRLMIRASIMGLKANANLYTSCKYTHVSLSEEGKRINTLLDERNAPQASELSRQRLREHEKEVTMRVSPPNKNLPSYEIDRSSESRDLVSTTTDSLAHQRNGAYWAEVSPVPMDSLEVRSFAIQDSLSRAWEQRRAKYASKANNNAYDDENNSSQEQKITPLQIPIKLITGGRIYQQGNYRLDVKRNMIAEAFSGYNSADRLRLGAMISLRRYTPLSTKEGSRSLWITDLGAAYAQGRKAWLWHTGIEWLPNPAHNVSLKLDAGRSTEDLAHEGIDMHKVNTIGMLLSGEGYLSLYDRHYARLSGSFMPSSALSITGSIGYEHSQSLTKLPRQKSLGLHRPPSLSWGRARSMVELNDFIPVPKTSTVIADLSLQWVPRPYHTRSSTGYLRYDRLGERSPVLALRIEGAYSTSEQGSKYALIQARVWQRLRLRRYLDDFLSYHVLVGAYPYKAHITPERMQYIKGSNSFVALSPNEKELSLHTLPAYTAISARAYGIFNLGYETPRLLINRLPIKVLRYGSERLSVKWLMQSGSTPYCELGYSWGFDKALRLGVYWGRPIGEGKSGTALRLEIDL